MSNGDASLGPVKAGQEGIGFLVHQAARAFDARLTSTISQYGLDTDQFTVIRHLVREIDSVPDGVRVSELSSTAPLERIAGFGGAV